MHRLRFVGAASLAAVAAAVAPGVAGAQYTAPPPDPGFTYIFDGSATGSDASFDKWAFAAGTFSQSRPISEGGQGAATLNTVEGAIQVNASPFGGYWYPVKPFGDAVLRLQYTVQNTPESTRNGGVMVRSPEIRYSCPDATGQPSQCATTNDVLALKPAGYNYDVCGAALPLCGRDDARGLDVLQLGRRPWPVPAVLGQRQPAAHLHGPVLRAPGMANQINWPAPPPSSTTTATPATTSTGRRSCAAMRSRSTSR